MSKPGVMIYFEILPAIQLLSDEERGKLLIAILEYASQGVVPVFEGALTIAWAFIQPKLDRDDEKYERVSLQKQFAVFCREQKRKGLPDISFDIWLEKVSPKKDHMVSPDTMCNPSATATAETSASAVSTSETSNCAVDSEFEILWKAYPEVRRGSYEQAVSTFRARIVSPKNAALAIENLRLWKQSDQWVKEGGQFIPSLKNWLERGIWQSTPAKMAIPTGASGELGEAELEAIQRVLTESTADVDA